MKYTKVSKAATKEDDPDKIRTETCVVFISE